MDAGVPSAQTEDQAAPGTEPALATVVLVDDMELTRMALKQLLSADGLEVVGEAGTGEDGVTLVVDL